MELRRAAARWLPLPVLKAVSRRGAPCDGSNGRPLLDGELRAFATVMRAYADRTGTAAVAPLEERAVQAARQRGRLR